MSKQDEWALAGWFGFKEPSQGQAVVLCLCSCALCGWAVWSNNAMLSAVFAFQIGCNGTRALFPQRSDL